MNPTWTPDANPFHELLPIFTADRPEVHGVIARMRRVFDEYPERVLIGEIYLPVERLVHYYGEQMAGAHLPFNFQLIAAPWDARHIARLIEEYEAALPAEGWPNWVLGNHDNHRIATRVGDAQARIAAMLLLTLRGTPTLYYGDELGMHDVDIPHDRVQDPFEKNVPGKGLGRDPERTPMQWDPSPAAGFTCGTPWLPVAADCAEINVQRQRDDADSMLSLYRRLIVLRRGEPALEVGRFEPLPAGPDVLAYLRRGREGEASFAIVLNFASAPRSLAATEMLAGACVAVATDRAREGEVMQGDIALAADQGLVLRLAGAS